MRPLLFVNWRRVNTRFTALMWFVACVLAMVLLIHVAGATRAGSAVAHPAPRGVLTHVSLQGRKPGP